MYLNISVTIDVLKGVLQIVKAGCVKNPPSTFHDTQSQRDDDGDNNKNDMSYNITVDDKYCAMIIRLEIQTIEFYFAAADSLRG